MKGAGTDYVARVHFYQKCRRRSIAAAIDKDNVVPEELHSAAAAEPTCSPLARVST